MTEGSQEYYYYTYEEGDSFIPNVEEDEGEDPRRSVLQEIINKFKVFISDISVTLQLNNFINIEIPSSLIPLTLRVAYGFSDSDTLLNISLLLKNFSWNDHPQLITITNPDSENFNGKVLINKKCNKFFSPDFKPKSNYRSAPLIIRSQNNADYDVVTHLESIGYTHMQSVRAAALCQNDFERCVTFLQTGQYQKSGSNVEILLSYKDCPLAFFILELLDAILDLQDHCCMCGKPTALGLRPGCCNEPLCQHQFIFMGVGVSLIKEIKRDPYVLDLLMTVFTSSFKTKFFNPKPEFETNETLDSIVKKFPKLKQLNNVQNDPELYSLLGRDMCNILRWILFSCRSNFLLLPPQLEFKQFKSDLAHSHCYQFMALTASPDQENIFQQMKKTYGSRFLWHGSPLDRWHSIIREGLRNLSNTNLMRVGAAFGEGIYFAKSSNLAFGYAIPGDNLYEKSELGKNVRIMALCEVINFPIGQKMEVEVNVNDENGSVVKKKLTGILRDFSDRLTLTMNEAVIVRFLLVNLDKVVDVCNNPPTNIPTLIQVLKLRANIQ